MNRFSLNLLIGLVIGLLLGVGGAELWRRAHSDIWIEAGGEWHRLPSQAAAGSLPQTFAIPAKAWDYGATTRALPAPVTQTPAIVRVDVGEVSGPVGVSLAKPDGSALISKEKMATAGATPVSLYFRSPGSQPVAVLLRNAGVEGTAGSVTVRDVKYAPEASIPPRQLGKINKAGVG